MKCESELTEKEFFVVFCDKIKDVFLNSWRSEKRKKELSISQRQAIIKLIEKKNKDKGFITNYRPISLLNIDYETISKALAARLNKILPNLISPHEMVYVQKRMPDIVEVTDIFNKEGFLVKWISKTLSIY